MEVYENQIALPLASRTATEQSPDFRAYGATGLHIGVQISTGGAGTFTLQILGKEPFAGTYYQVNVDLAVTAVSAGRHHYFLGPGVALQPPGESADTTAAAVRQAVAATLPDVFAINIVQSDPTALLYGVWFRRVP